MESEKYIELSPFRQQVRELVGEFRKVLKIENYNLSPQTDAVILLSGPRVDESGTVEGESSQENISRVALCKASLDQLAQKINKEGNLNSMLLPEVVINAATEQMNALKQMCLEVGIPESKIRLLDCGEWSQANTKTQFEAWVENFDCNRKQHPVFVSSSYHLPRVFRTAKMKLPKNLSYEIIGAPFNQTPFEVFRVVRGEIKKILKYSGKGDITDSPSK